MDIEQVKATLLFPVKDENARRQFLTACLVVLAGVIVPVIPLFFLMGYGARIARRIVVENKEPCMLPWEDWNELFQDGLRLYGIRIIVLLPILVLMLIGVALFILLPIMLGIQDQGRTGGDLSPLGAAGFVLGIVIFLLVGLLAAPLGFLVLVADTHVAVKGSFSAGLQLQEWWPILRKGLGQFLIAYLIVFVTSFVMAILIQIAFITIILICIVPFLIFPYTAYISLVAQALFAQAYASGQATLRAPAPTGSQ